MNTEQTLIEKKVKEFREKYIYTHQNGAWESVGGTARGLKAFLTTALTDAQAEGYKKGYTDRGIEALHKENGE